MPAFLIFFLGCLINRTRWSVDFAIAPVSGVAEMIFSHIALRTGFNATAVSTSTLPF
jgi:hypothetical protein